jgi:hypothetical protein
MQQQTDDEGTKKKERDDEDRKKKSVGDFVDWRVFRQVKAERDDLPFRETTGA